MANIRIVDADFYSAPPINGLDSLISEFRGTPIHKVPVIRIFGATDDGNKTCLHVHGVFPYIYIPHDGKENYQSLCYKLANAIDKTLNIALGQAASKVHHVYKINLITGIPYYGFHAREHQFFKIYFFNPHLMRKVCTFLENGTILDRVYQPHEAHIPYIQQFMIDYNLHGMSFIQISEIHHRQRNGIAPIISKTGNYVLPAIISRLSRCDWECDVRADTILNVRDVSPNAMTNPGISAIWADERQRRVDVFQSSQVSHCLTHNRSGLEPTQSHIVYHHQLQERLLSFESLRNERQEVDTHNVSIYPAETPESSELLSSSSLSLDISYIEASNEDEDFNDAAGQKLYEVLCDLAESNEIAQRTAIPEDSILSQPTSNINLNENMDSDEEGENDLDLSLPLELTLKQYPLESNNDPFENLSDSCFQNIPQFDGAYDLRSNSFVKPATVKTYNVPQNAKTEITKKSRETTKSADNLSHLQGIVKKVGQSNRESTVIPFNKWKTTEQVKSKPSIAKSKKHVNGNLDSKVTVLPKRIKNEDILSHKSRYLNENVGDITGKFHERSSQSTPKRTSTTLPKKISESDGRFCKLLESSDIWQLIENNRRVSPIHLRKMERIDQKKNVAIKIKKKCEKKRTTKSNSLHSQNEEEEMNENTFDKITRQENRTLNTSIITQMGKKSKIALEKSSSFGVNTQTTAKSKLINDIGLALRNGTNKFKKMPPLINITKIETDCDSFQRNEIEICEQNDTDSFIATHSSKDKSLCKSSLASFDNSCKASVDTLVVSRYNFRNRKIIEYKESATIMRKDLLNKLDEIITKPMESKPNNHIGEQEDDNTITKSEYIKSSDFNSKNVLKMYSKPSIINNLKQRDANEQDSAINQNNEIVNVFESCKGKVISKNCNRETNIKSLNDVASRRNDTDNTIIKIKFPENRSIRNGDKLIKGATKYYKKVSIKKCLNNILPCNHFKRQCHEIEKKSAISDNGFSKNTVSCSNKASGINYLLNEQFNNKMITIKLNDMPILDFATPICSSGISTNDSLKKIVSNKSLLKENVAVNSLTTIPVAQKRVNRINKSKAKAVVQSKLRKHKQPQKIMISPKILRCRKKLSSKILAQEIQKDMTNYIALQSGKRPKFNLIYGRNIPVVPLNVKKFNCTQFPNTQWSSELTTPTSNIIVLENRKLTEHEKYDLSTLVPLVSHVASPQKMRNRSMTPVTSKMYLPNNILIKDLLYAYDILDYNESSPHTCNFSKSTNELSGIHLNNFDYPDVNENILNFDQFLEDIDTSPNSVNSSSSMNDSNLDNNNIDFTFNFARDNMQETLADSSLSVINKQLNKNISEDAITLEDDDDSQTVNADFQFILDKNNYRSQITMEKFRYIKMKQDRAFGNLMKRIFRIVENSNINGRLIIEEAERKTEFENSILDDDDTERCHFFLNKTVRFSKRVLVREFISNEAIGEQLYQDFSYRLDASDLLQWINLKRSRTYDHLLSLDGPNDSSDEDECSQIPKKKAKTILKKPSYKSLPLTCGKLSQVTHTGSRDIQFSPDTAKIDDATIKNQKWMESTISSHPQLSSSSISSNITNCDKNVPSTAKRKLKFQEINIKTLDKTIAEETTSCRYSVNTYSPNIRSINPHSNKIVKCTRIKPEAVSSNIKKCDYKPVFDEAIEKDNSSDDLFSDEEDNVLKHLTKSERYDLETNYAPKAGTSTMKSGDKLNNMPGTCNVSVTPLKGENNTLFEVIDKINAASYSGSSSDILSHTESLKQIELDTTITPSYSNEDCDSLFLGDITTFRKVKELDNTLTQPQNLTQNLTMYESSPKINYKETTDGFYEIVPKYKPPTKEFIQSTMLEFNIPIVRSQSPFYGNANDVTGPVEVGMRSLYIRGKTSQYLRDFHDRIDAFAKAISNFSKTLSPDRKFTSQEINNLKMTFFGNETCVVETVCRPPSKADVELWIMQKKLKLEKLMPAETSVSTIQTSLKSNNDTARNTNVNATNIDTSNKSLGSNVNNSSESSVIVSPTKIVPLSRNSDYVSKNAKQLIIKISENTSAVGRSLDNSCQITGATLNNTHGFQMPLENLQNARAVHEHQHLTVLVMELHVQTRGDFKPNPELDALCAIFFAIFNDTPNGGTTPRHMNGLFAVNTPPTSASQSSGTHLNGAGVSCSNINYFDDEVSLINGFIAFLHDCDPDILVGYEIQMLSWGYLIDRSATLGINLYPLLSRIEGSSPGNREKHEDAFGDLYISGRIVLDLWRILKHEIALQSYTFENIVYHILHQRVPLHSFRNLTGWWSHRFPYHRHKTAEYYLYRVKTTLQLIDQLDLIGRTSEMARLFGILFYEVLSRGSQFRVESMMLRIAKPLKYIPVSPSVQQRAKMRAPEFVPLILEPESKLYTDPVIVLDFQSLYPSIIIAYNYCFSTCIGRVEHLGNNAAFEFGATQLRIARRKVRKLLHADHLNFSPCGVAFVKNVVRQGILPRMLQDILDTRLMVKKSMKIHKDNKTLQRVLHSRQLGLKLIANVTYGYTAANFSGRMPAVEVGDSVVAKGRETLLRAIKLVESNTKWNCRVVYGDTDSLFVLVPGQCRSEAFRIGAEIAEAVTADNPSPVRLKLEKVYQPCILQTKKRYVGYMYESPDQNAPIFEAKGIETVRRDGCPAVSKMLEKCIRILFDLKNVSEIKKYVLRQFSKIVNARASIQDLTFAKEYRGASGYRPGAYVPALELTRKWTTTDKRNEPRSGERVPYIIVNGPPGLPLIRMVRSPHDLLSDDSLKPNALYYITRVIIPPINRCFKLIGADLHQWFNEMPRKQYKYLPTSSPNKGKKSTISQYFTTINCATCHEQTKDSVCPLCLTQPQRTCYILHEKLRTLEESYQNTLKICESCTGRKMDIQCISLDCPVLYRHIRNGRDLQQSNFIRELINNLPRLED